jgi:hypothetical protein
MTGTRLRNRFRTLTQDRAQPAMLTAGVHPRFVPDGRSVQGLKVQRALALALRAGIPADDAYPAVLHMLAQAGLPLRPIHFMPVWVPFLIGWAFGTGLAAMTLWLAEVLGGAEGPLAAVLLHGWTGALGAAAIFGVVLAAAVRLQARRARLPRWSDV